MSGKIVDNGSFTGTYITTDGSKFPITGTFANGHATLTKQPVIPNGISGVNIIFELNFMGKGSTNYGVTTPSGTYSSLGNGLLSWLGKNPVIPVIGVVTLFALMGLTGAVKRGLTGRKTAGRQATSNTVKNRVTGKASRVILQRGPTYSPSESSNPDVPSKLIGPDDALGGTPISGAGAYAMPVNQGGLSVQAGVTRCGIGNIWSNGIVEQPDANYTPTITRINWATDYTFERYPDHFFVNFTNAAPHGAYFDWIITR